MATILRMPGVSADSTEADLLEWLVSPGSALKRGEPIAVVETDKATVELEAEEDAVLLATLASPGESVTVGAPIAVLVQPGEEARGEEAILAELGLGSGNTGQGNTGQGDSGHENPGLASWPAPDEDRSQDELVPGATPAIEHTADAIASGDQAAGANGAGTRIFISPLARRMAAAAGILLADITGSGPGGRITRRDVEAAISRAPAPRPAATPAAPAATSAVPGAAPAVPIAAPAAALTAAPAATSAAAPAARPGAAAVSAVASPGAFTDIPHTRMRRAIAAALTASKQQVPHFYLRATCRVDALLKLREAVNSAGGPRISVNDFFVKAAGRALIDVPEMNAIWTPDAVRRFESADVAVAVATETGLLTPVVRSVQSRSLSDIAAAIKDLGARASGGSLKQQELEGGCMTVSNLGMFGVEEFSAIINPPQAAILAVGAATSQPTQAPDGSVEFGRFVTVVLSVDHRPVDGVISARWLQRFTHLIETPLHLLV